jgi:hypothetical protein
VFAFNVQYAVEGLGGPMERWSNVVLGSQFHARGVISGFHQINSKLQVVERQLLDWCDNS